MALLNKIKSDLDEKFQKVLKTPASFDFFVAIHGFIKHIEINPSLSRKLSRETKNKYSHLKEIYQGLEDAKNKSDADLGHARYMIIQDLNKIRNKNFSESNSFWKKRDLFRRLAGEIYEGLNLNPC